VCVRHADEVDQRLAGHENLGQLVHGQRCRWLPGSSARVARPKHSPRSTAAVQPLREITDDATDMPGPEYASMRVPRLNARKSVNRRISFYDARAFRAQHLPTRDVRSTDSVAPPRHVVLPCRPRGHTGQLLAFFAYNTSVTKQASALRAAAASQQRRFFAASCRSVLAQRIEAAVRFGLGSRQSARSGA
jgi:hypothetical protein